MINTSTQKRLVHWPDWKTDIRYMHMPFMGACSYIMILRLLSTVIMCKSLLITNGKAFLDWLPAFSMHREFYNKCLQGKSDQ